MNFYIKFDYYFKKYLINILSIILINIILILMNDNDII
jgi:hypothetical protein